MAATAPDHPSAVGAGAGAGAGADGSKSTDKTIVLQSKDCPVDSVTVFNNRAEVTRVCTVNLEGVGEYDIQVRGFPACVETESVRVNGTGHITLREVAFGVHHRPVVRQAKSDDEADDDTSSRVEKWQAEMKRLNSDNARISTRITETQAAKQLLDKFADAMLTRAKQTTGAPALSEALDFSMTLLEKHAAKSQALNDTLAALREQKRQNNETISLTNQRLASVGQSSRQDTFTSREVSVVLDATKPGVVKLRLVYMVTKASWKPAYDIRINSDDTAVDFTYYGTIKQTTGEDWRDTKIVLSTATPSVGGVAPVLPTRHVKFQPTYNHSSIRRKGGARTSSLAEAAAAPRMMNMQAQMFDDDMALEREEIRAPAAAVATSTVDSSGAAATFTIEHRKSIASDNKDHKVSVAILSLKGSFRYYTVPALNSVAYLQCLTMNTSEYTFLASSAVNVFLDNSFVSKTSIPDVAPGQKFRNFLGVDNGVKVNYKRVSNVHEERGFFSKSDATTHAFSTTVTNNKKFPIRLVVADMLPIADDTTIKVKLIEPTPEQVEAGTKAEAARDNALAAGAGGAGGAGAGAGAGATAGALPRGGLVAQNSTTHNLVWTRDVAAGAKAVIRFKYEVECPNNRHVVTYDQQ